MRVAVVGLGFVGLSMATVLASRGNYVIGVDVDREKCNLVQRKKVPFFEPGVNDLLNATLEKSLFITTEMFSAVSQSQIIFVCVGTPSNTDGSANLAFLQNVCSELGEILKNEKSAFKVIAVKSTVPPLTSQTLVKPTLEGRSAMKAGVDFGISMNPEFLREGSAVDDMLSPNLVVIGADDEKTKQHMRQFYTELYQGREVPIIETSTINAELIKYANNAFLATKISFINTIANICNRIPNSDVEIIAKAMGYDPRIGSLFLKAGPGYGGSCFPKDVMALLHFSRSLGYEPDLIEATHFVNQSQPFAIIELVRTKFSQLKDIRFAVLGLAFKRNTDDIRESVSIKVVNSLLEAGAKVKVHDPLALKNFERIYGNTVTYCTDVLKCIEDTDCCIILTEWDTYKDLKPSTFKSLMKFPFVIDARRVLDASKMSSIDYIAIGLGTLKT